MSTVVTIDSDHKSLHSRVTYFLGVALTPPLFAHYCLPSIPTNMCSVLNWSWQHTSSQVLMANASDSICKSKGWKEQLQGLSSAQEWGLSPPLNTDIHCLYRGHFSSVSTTQDL